jgi:Uma2 family endonuclease
VASALAKDLSGLSPEIVAQYLAAPETQVAEILDGELFLQSRPGRRHARAASRLGMKLGGPFDLGDGGPGGWVILFEPELWLGPRPDIVVPDVAGWRRERLPNALEDEAGEAHYEIAPDWVCEVISSSTEATDRGKKRRIYRREGVGHLWLLLPQSQALEVYRLDGGAWREVDTFEGNTKVRAEPFDAVELDLSVLWAT